MGDAINIVTLKVDIQENGIIRDAKTGLILARLSKDNGVDFEMVTDLAKAENKSFSYSKWLEQPTKEKVYNFTLLEAIEAIKKNYPPSSYSMLREALDMAMDAMQEKAAKEAEAKENISHSNGLEYKRKYINP